MAAPRPSPDPNSAAAFADALTAARVVDTVQLRPFAAEFRATTRDGSATDFATFLVNAGVLTEFQAQRVLEGQAAKLLLGPYLLAAPIGSGSLGTVYQAVNRQDRKRYAVKVLPLRSLWNVVQAKAQLSTVAGLPPHPVVIPFVDVDSAAGSHYLVWQFAEGETLDSALRKRGPFEPEAAIDLVERVADALAACHAHGVVHGLVKPSNILVAPDGTSRLLDLGVGAILVDNIADDESMLDTISTANAAMGMLDCCAPETINTPAVRTPAGDCYSLGCVLHCVLTGKLPFPDGNAIEKVLAHQASPPPTASARNPAVPAWLDELIVSLMAKNPAARPTAAATVAILRNPPAAAEADSRTDADGTAPAPREPMTFSPGTPVLSLPPHRLPQLKPTSPSLIEFELPQDETTDPGLSLPAASATDEPSDVTDIILTANGTPVPRPLVLKAAYDRGVRTEAEVWPAEAPSGPPTPIQYGTVAPPPDAESPVPPLPDFARSLSRRFLRTLFFWRPWPECVQVTIFGPREVAPGENIKLQVFTHHPDAFESVCTLSRAFQHDGEMLGTGYVTQPIDRGTVLGMHLSVTNAGVGRSLLEVTWLGQPQPRSFDVHVPWESPAGMTQGTLSAGLGDLLAGQIGFRFKILPRR